MNRIIFGHYFGDTSIFSNKTAKNGGRGYHACKYVEIFYLWYLYIREFLLKDYHIFISDVASPISINWMLEKIKEPTQILLEKEMKLDFSKKIHIKKFKNLVTHQQGWIRIIKDWWRICIENNIDFFTVESDGLVAYDISKDLENIDFLMREDNPYKGSIYFIKNILFHKKIYIFKNTYDLLLYLDTASQLENHLKTSEGGIEYIKDNIAENAGRITRTDLCLQDCSVDKLKRFIIENPINNNYIKQYLDNLK